MTKPGKAVDLFTDGACSGNPGPGGWGAILRFKGVEKELSGAEGHTTKSEIEASLRLLESHELLGTVLNKTEDSQVSYY